MAASYPLLSVDGLDLPPCTCYLRCMTKRPTGWSEGDIRSNLNQNQIRVLAIFAEGDKPYIDSDELIKKLGKTGKETGAVMAGFGKISDSLKKEPLVFPAFGITKGEHRGTRWAIKPEYLKMVRKIIKELEPYMN